MATSGTEIYNSIVLQPGEQFTIPPGATLVGADDPESITSDCELPELETLECYTAVLIIGGTEGNESQAWEAAASDGDEGGVGGEVTIKGVAIRNSNGTITETNFSGDYRFRDFFGFYGDATQLREELRTAIKAISGTITLESYVPSSTDRYQMFYIMVETVPSAISDVFIMAKTNSVGSGDVIVYLPFYANDSDYMSDKPNAPSCD